MIFLFLFCFVSLSLHERYICMVMVSFFFQWNPLLFFYWVSSIELMIVVVVVDSSTQSSSTKLANKQTSKWMWMNDWRRRRWKKRNNFKTFNGNNFRSISNKIAVKIIMMMMMIIFNQRRKEKKIYFRFLYVYLNF